MFDTVSQKTLKAKKGDTACDIIITLTENGKVYQIAEGCHATFTAKKADGNFLYNEETCSIEGNNITYGFTEQTTACEGMVDCEIVLYGADGNRLTSPRFTLQVGGTVYNGEEIISTPETDAMEHLIEEANDAINNINKVIPETLQPFNIPIGHPDGSGRQVDSGRSYLSLQTTDSFYMHGGELAYIEPCEEGADPSEWDYTLKPSGITFDDLAFKSDIPGGGGSTDNWRLINELTLTEDAVVVISKDKDGNPFSLKKFEITVAHPAVTSATNMWIGINGIAMAQTSGSSASATKPTYRIIGELSEFHGWDFRSVISNSGGRALATIWAYPLGHRYDKTPPKAATEIKISKSAALTSLLSSGAKIKIQGVDA